MFLTVYMDVCGVKRAQKPRKKNNPKLSEAERSWKAVDPTRGINAHHHFPLLVFSYCVYLRVKQASAACKLRLWSAHLVRERLICAECQSDAMSKSDRCGGDGMQSSR